VAGSRHRAGFEHRGSATAPWRGGELTLTEPHDYAVEWTHDRVRFFIDGRWVKTVVQSIDYPVQFMLDVYEFPRADGTRDEATLPHVFRVERVRSFPPR